MKEYTTLLLFCSLMILSCGSESSDEGNQNLSPEVFSSIKTYNVNGVSFKMITVEGGTFTMGATSEQGRDADSDEKPPHSVTLSSYNIGETEVTQELWQAVMGSNPSVFKDSNRPVEMVSWRDCQNFITRLNALTDENFRLPTEAEWEFAARGGNRSKGYKYAGSNTIDDVAWYNSNRTHDVATKQPNELGLYDMSGNVHEWCYDWYGDYSSSAQTNPTGPATGFLRVHRGGGRISDAEYCRTSHRCRILASYYDDGIGFRLAQPTINLYISLDTRYLEFASGSGSKMFRISSNMSWAISSDQKTWCSVSPTSGSGDGSVEVSVDENTSTSSRTATITVTTPSITLTLAVTQKGKGTATPSSQYKTFFVGDSQFRMVYVEGGTFTMGATSEQGSDAWDDEKPAHSVTLSSYSIGETEVTQALWQAVMGSNPSYFSGSIRPVEQVSWNDCQDFITRLNAMTGENFRLPTEAEWEFAARGGNKSRGYKYAGSDWIGDVAWYGDDFTEITHEVAIKQANELGLYDMSGNVWEWCGDWYDSYSSSEQTNPIGPASGEGRVCRGGSWFDSARDCRTSIRYYYMPSYRNDYLGFRLAL